MTEEIVEKNLIYRSNFHPYMKVLGNLMNSPCIYKIENLKTGDLYIGSSKDGKVRFARHITKLRAGTHTSSYLQNAYNKYGEENFMFTVLEYPVIESRHELYEIEQFYLNKLKPSYNMSKNVFGIKWSTKHREAKAKSSKRLPDAILKKYSERMSENWQNPEYRANLMSKFAEDSWKESHSKAAKDLWARDGMKDRIAESRTQNMKQRGTTGGKHSFDDIYKMRELYDSGVRIFEISKSFPLVPYGSIWRIVTRKAWKNL